MPKDLQQCLDEICDNIRCRMYKEIKLSFSGSYHGKFVIQEKKLNIHDKMFSREKQGVQTKGAIQRKKMHTL